MSLCVCVGGGVHVYTHSASGNMEILILAFLVELKNVNFWALNKLNYPGAYLFLESVNEQLLIRACPSTPIFCPDLPDVPGCTPGILWFICPAARVDLC